MVRWESGRRSENVDDRRNQAPRGIALGGGGTILLAVVIFFLSGGNLGQVLRFFLANPQLIQAPAAPAPPAPEENKLADFASVILGYTEDVWTGIFADMGERYRPCEMVLYRGRVSTGCGLGSAAAGPFYCPADEKVYLDLSFYEELKRKFGAPGDFAQAYVIAHEVGHHVQKLLGITDRRAQMLRHMTENEFSVRLELQADFFAGVWARQAEQRWHIMEPGDIEEGLNAASAIGDDTLQKKSQGYVVPDSFTHGSSAQRVRWFRKGYETGDLRQGDTFSAKEL